MKRMLTLFLSIFLSISYANADTHFSPYIDFTLNTHWDQQYQSLESMDLNALSNASHVQHFHLAFITDAGQCVPAWGGQPMYSIAESWGKHTTDKLRAAKLGYTVSLGGASGNDLSLYCSNEQLISAFETILATYQPDGLDFDIENGTANVTRLVTALQSTQAHHPSLTLSFTLPIMPDGLTQTGKAIITEAKQAGLHFHVNIMAMDYGPSFTESMGQYAIQAATALFNDLTALYPEKSTADIWGMIEVTPMIGVNDVAVEQFSLTDADRLHDFALEHQLGRLSMWSMNRDFPCADKWTNTNCSGNNLQTAAYQFSQRLM